VDAGNSRRSPNRNNPRKSRSLALTCVLLFCAAVLVAQPTTLQAPPPGSGTTLEQKTEWLVRNPDHTASLEVLDEIFAEIASLDQLLLFVGTLLPDLPPGELLTEAASRSADLLMTARSWEQAAGLYQMAWESSGRTEFRALFRQAQLLVEMGDLSGAESRARTVVLESSDYELKRRAYALVARVMHMDGRSDDAAAILSTLIALDDPALVEADAFLLMSIVLQSTSDETEANALERRLAELLPDSIVLEYDRSQVVAAPTPAALALGMPGFDRMADNAEETSPAVTAIQVASFVDADNAHQLALDLADLGLEVVQRTAVRDGMAFEQVLIPVLDGSARDAEQILARLHDAGYDGLLIY
jgi:tetratricopeptide (TPR) repeat protein